MVLSMTGFGREEGVFDGKKISVEIKSLNSKNLDLSLRLPLRYKEKEFEIRKILSDKILRGKVECYVSSEALEDHSHVKLNEGLIQAYINQLQTIASDGPQFEYLKMAVRMPDAISSKGDDLHEAEWEFLVSLVHKALEKFSEFRIAEGSVLGNELLNFVSNIEEYLQAVSPFESERMDSVKQRYKTALMEFDQVDETRFYQELAYYTEKLDISEEKVRLKQHLGYYKEVLNNESFNGKKLGFIAQEMGREINTMGSKANHAEIQKLVVKMKDDLEKIKEQTLNVL